MLSDQNAIMPHKDLRTEDEEEEENVQNKGEHSNNFNDERDMIEEDGNIPD